MEKRIYFSFLTILMLFLMLASLSFTHAATLKIPKWSDWTDRGKVLSKGSGWDAWIGQSTSGKQGMASPCGVVKKGSTYYLYYIGAKGARSDGGPAHRKIGVATSSNGLSWSRYSGNPIITHNPGGSSCVEEGIYAAASFLDSDGKVVIYFGGMQGCGGSVDGDIVLATSSDGKSFSVHGDVIKDGGSNCPSGYNDELFAVQAYQHAGKYYVYYLGKGSAGAWDLLLNWGTKTGLSGNKVILNHRKEVRGMSGAPIIHENQLIIPVLIKTGSSSDWQIEMRETTIGNTSTTGTIRETYTFNIESGCIYLDKPNNRWMLFYVDRGATGIYLKTAPAGYDGTALEGALIDYRPLAVGKTDITIFNICGKQIAKLTANSQQLKAGIPWIASNNPSGIYIAKLITGNRTITKRLMLLK
jgi:hypothetical protein